MGMCVFRPLIDDSPSAQRRDVYLEDCTWSSVFSTQLEPPGVTIFPPFGRSRAGADYTG